MLKYLMKLSFMRFIYIMIEASQILLEYLSHSQKVNLQPYHLFDLCPQHGGGQVFKTLQKLVQNLEAGRISKGVIVADEEICASRHLKHCALEQNIPMTVSFAVIISQSIVINVLNKSQSSLTNVKQ